MKRPRLLSSRRRANGDDGVTIILFALAIVAILFIVATVIDYGNVRSSRQNNKLSTDVVASAGLQKLAPDGDPMPWEAACQALEFLELNHPDLDFTITYMDGDGTERLDNPCATALATECDPADINTPGDLPTWAWINATSGDRAFDIKTGYVMPDPDFPEDVEEYSGDVGAAAQGGCDQLAVITSRTDGALFGGIADRDDYTTLARTVGRVQIGQTSSVAVALVLLEQSDCAALNFDGGGGTGHVFVRGTGARPGIIHADSDGTGDDCPDVPVIVGTQNGGPRVRALAAPSDPNTHGIISTYHRLQGGTNDANWTSDRLSPDTHVWLCDPDDVLLTSASPCETGPTGGDRLTRTPADVRFLSDVTNLRTQANTVFNQIASGTPAGYTAYNGDCNLTGGANSGDPNVNLTTVQVPTGKLYVNCPGSLRVGNNKSFTVESGITEVAFQGGMEGGGTIDLRAPSRVYVNNNGNSATPVNVGSQLVLKINANNQSSCAVRQAAAPNATTELVIRAGAIDGDGGGTMWLCSTFVHLMGGATSNAPVDTSAASYPAPYDNIQNGFFEVGGGGSVQWTAPNTTPGVPGVGTYRFEDLAVWSETQRDNIVTGGGSLVLSGIFFLPNTGPSSGVCDPLLLEEPPCAAGGFRVRGGGGGAIEVDAQLWVRKFSHNGTAQFRMRANPENSIQVPFLIGSGIVR